LSQKLYGWTTLVVAHTPVAPIFEVAVPSNAGINLIFKAKGNFFDHDVVGELTESLVPIKITVEYQLEAT
jgi:hypothetical protein